jgi:hypothetical protein
LATLPPPKASELTEKNHVRYLSCGRTRILLDG